MLANYFMHVLNKYVLSNLLAAPVVGLEDSENQFGYSEKILFP